MSPLTIIIIIVSLTIAYVIVEFYSIKIKTTIPLKTEIEIIDNEKDYIDKNRCRFLKKGDKLILLEKRKKGIHLVDYFPGENSDQKRCQFTMIKNELVELWIKHKKEKEEENQILHQLYKNYYGKKISIPNDMLWSKPGWVKIFNNKKELSFRNANVFDNYNKPRYVINSEGSLRVRGKVKKKIIYEYTAPQHETSTIGAPSWIIFLADNFS